MDKLKAASLSKKLNELHIRVVELQDQTYEQIELIKVFSTHIGYLMEEIQNEDIDGEREV